MSIAALMFLSAAVAAGCGESREAVVPASGGAPRVLAFYYPWYGTPRVTGAWRHWNEGGHNPDVIDPATGFRDIGATDHPAPDVYDSNDHTVLRRQLQTAREFGIDGYIVSWWGRGSYEDHAFAQLMDEADAAGARTKLTIYYESIPGWIDVQAAVDDLTYILSTYGSRPSFQRFEGHPAVFVYSRAIYPGLSCSGASCPPGLPLLLDWTPILSGVRARFPNTIVFADLGSLLSTDAPQLAAMGFDGLHIYNPQVDLNFFDPDPLYANLIGRARQLGMRSAASIIPGYDDSHIGRPNAQVRPREGGGVYQRLWEAAQRSQPDLFLITTFNEWHEGTEIEPSAEYQSLFLQLTAQYSQATSR